MPRRAVLALVGAYIMLRGALLAWHFDEVAMPPFEIGVIGNMARLASGGDLVLPLYSYFDNVGGHVVVGLIAALPYALLGDSYMTLKLVPLGLGVGTLLLLIHVAHRLAGPRAAWTAALLFILAPPTLLKYSLLAKGNHFEGLFFQLAAFAAFCRAHDGPRRSGRITAAGLAAGFACSFNISSLILVSGILVAHLALTSGRQLVRDAPAAFGGFALGVLPLVWIGFAPGGRLVSFLSAKLAPLDAGWPARFARRVGHLLGEILPHSGAWPAVGPMPAWAPELLFLVAYLIAWGLLMARVRGALGTRGEDRRFLLALPALLYLPLFAVAFAASTFDFDPYLPPVEVGRYRYMVPHLLWSILLISVAGASSRCPGARALLGRTALVAAGAAVLPTLSLLSGRSSEARTGIVYPGSHFPYFANVMFKESELHPITGERTWDYAEMTRLLQRMPEGPRHETAFGLGHHMTWVEISPEVRNAEHPRELSLERLLSQATPETAIDFARGAGSRLRATFASGAAGRELARSTLAHVLAQDHPMTPYLVEGLCGEFGFPLELVTERDLDLSHALEPLVPAPQHGAWARGLGLQCGRLLSRGFRAELERVRAEARSVTGADAQAFWFGFGWGVAEGAARSRSIQPWLAEPPPDQRASACAGFGAGQRHLRGAEQARQAVESSTRGLEPDLARAMQAGAAWPDYPRPPEARSAVE